MPGPRGDLGFIPNNARGSIPNRLFFGSPGHPSRKGAQGVSQLSKMNNTTESDTSLIKSEIHTDELITKRTEYLETQERRLTATLNENRSETNRLGIKLEENDSKLIQTIEDTRDLIAANSLKLFNEIQTVYGKVKDTLHGFDCEDGRADHCMTVYKQNKIPLKSIADKNTWVMLVYPMVNVEDVVDDTNITNFFMKCKTVDKHTGQINLSWVLVFQKKGEKETKFISEFSLLGR